MSFKVCANVTKLRPTLLKRQPPGPVSAFVTGETPSPAEILPIALSTRLQETAPEGLCAAATPAISTMQNTTTTPAPLPILGWHLSPSALSGECLPEEPGRLGSETGAAIDSEQVGPPIRYLAGPSQGWHL